MTGSALVSEIVPAAASNFTKGRKNTPIRAITIHHMAARWSARRCGEAFQAESRNASTHYGIGFEGEIAQYVDEKDTAWANSNSDSNRESVTIETANSRMGDPWPVSEKTLESLIRLVADIAKRNHLLPLVKGKNLNWHQMFSNTACPGPYLLSMMDSIVERANRLAGAEEDISLLPVSLSYQVYTTRWLGNVSGCDTKDPIDGYAGVFGCAISKVYVSASVGDVFYRVHTKDGKWLPEVKNREDFAGITGKSIDGFMIRGSDALFSYQVHVKGESWLPAVSGYDESDSKYGYAGTPGKEIDAILIRCQPMLPVAEETENKMPQEEKTKAEPTDKLIAEEAKTSEEKDPAQEEKNCAETVPDETESPKESDSPLSQKEEKEDTVSLFKSFLLLLVKWISEFQKKSNR